jgi:hypothetical protein
LDRDVGDLTVCTAHGEEAATRFRTSDLGVAHLVLARGKRQIEGEREDSVGLIRWIHGDGLTARHAENAV